MERPLHLLAAVLNRGISASATARAQAAHLEGRSMGLRVTPPGLRFRVVITEGRAGIAADDVPADVELGGGPLDYQRLLLGDPRSLLRSGVVEVRGDTETAERFRDLLQAAGPDVEEILSRWIGDVAAHELGEAARGFARWARRASTSLARSLGEYLQEERRETPTRFEMEEFLAAVDELSNDVERAAARLERLAARLDS